MFYVNDQFYTVADIEKQYEIFESLSHLRECNNRRLAICTDDIFQYIALCLYIRQKGGSVVPIHSATPKRGSCKDCFFSRESPFDVPINQFFHRTIKSSQ